MLGPGRVEDAIESPALEHAGCGRGYDEDGGLELKPTPLGERESMSFVVDPPYTLPPLIYACNAPGI